MSGFAVGSKLLGIYLLYAGLSYVLSSIVLMDEGGSVILFQILGAAVALSFGWLLAFRTEGVTRLVGADGAGAGAAAREGAADLLRTGVILIGLYVFITRIAGAVRDIGFQADAGHLRGVGGALVQVLIALLPVILALLLVFRPDFVVKLISGKRSVFEDVSQHRAGNQSPSE